MKRILVCIALAALVGCSGPANNTVAQGVEYGMTQEQVLAHLDPTQKVLSRDQSQIVTEGFDRAWGMNRRNIFIFQNGKLAVHQNQAAQ